MILAVLITWSLGAVDPAAAVLVGRRTSLSAAEAQVLSQTISTHLVSAGVPTKLDAGAARTSLSRLGLKDASACNGRKACVSELGRQLAVAYVISLSLSRVGSDRSIALELLRVEDGVVLEKEALILAPEANITADQLASFSARVLTQLKDRPVVEAPPPQVTLPEPVVKAERPPVIITPPPPPQPKSHVTSFVLAGAGVVALGVATGLLVSGLNGRAEAYRTSEIDGVQRSAYSASEVQRRAAAGGVELGIAGGLAAAGLGFGTAAVITW